MNKAVHILQPAKAIYHRNDPYPKGGPRMIWPEPWQNHVCAFFGSFTAIGLLSFITYNTQTPAPLLIMSMGASAVLFHASPNLPLAQPRNCILGNLMSAIIGIILRLIFTDIQLRWLGAALAVSISIFVMMITNNIYPPGGATALAAATLPELPPWAGFQWVLMPVLLGTVIQLVIAIISNNLSKTRHYPDRWWN